VLKARQDYWGGAPCIETINFIGIPQDQPKFESLELGEIDVAFLRSPDVIAEARDTGEYDEFMELQSVGASILINQGVGSFDPIGQDLRFRQAVFAALDRDAISQRAFGGRLLEQTGIVQEESRWYTDGQPSPEEGMDLAKGLVEELKAEGWDGTVRLVCPNTVPDELFDELFPRPPGRGTKGDKDR
jgi:peptide/nickel transport system substrate-binding protein